MSMNVAGDKSGVMCEVNMTPLIDVMLVLIVTLIMTLPIQTHAVKLDLPVDNPNSPPPPIDPVKNKVVITANGQILWNGGALNQDQLRQYLEVSQQMNPIPELHLQPEPEAKYELVDEVLAVTKRAHVEKMGFVGNEAYMKF